MNRYHIESTYSRTVAACFVAFAVLLLNLNYSTPSTQLYAPSIAILAKCNALKLPAGPAPDFHARKLSDRFQSGTRPSLIKNATIWTSALNGTEIVSGDIFLDGGIIKAVGLIPSNFLSQVQGLIVYKADGAWVTPGLGVFGSGCPRRVFNIYQWTFTPIWVS